MRQSDVAAVMGITEQAYSCWERGTRQMTFAQAVQLADLFDCSLDDLAGRQRRADVVTLDESPVRSRLLQAFGRLNRAGCEALADTAESFSKIPAFVDGRAGGRDHTFSAIAG